MPNTQFIFYLILIWDEIIGILCYLLFIRQVVFFFFKKKSLACLLTYLKYFILQFLFRFNISLNRLINYITTFIYLFIIYFVIGFVFSFLPLQKKKVVIKGVNKYIHLKMFFVPKK